MRRLKEITWLGGVLSLWMAPLAGRAENESKKIQQQCPKSEACTVLQRRAEGLLAQAEPIEGAVVGLNPNTGEILIWAETHPGVATRATYPAASIFKLVTSSALIDKGIVPERKVCYHGGLHGLTEDLLNDDHQRDTSCVSFAQALGGSVNTVFGKLALRWLDTKDIAYHAQRFGFNMQLPFVPMPDISHVDIPEKSGPNRLLFAKTAAGFSGSYLSVLHGALIAAAIAHRGTIVLGKGKVHEVMSAIQSRTLTKMMEITVTEGTSRFAFVDSRGIRFLPGVRVAGKTGTLHVNEPFRAYNWWVGFAPADQPTLALGILLVNPAKWKLKPSTVARMLLETHLKKSPEP